MALTVDDLIRVLDYAERRNYDSFRYDGISVSFTKSMHAVAPGKAPSAPAGDDDDEDLLFHSSDA